MKPPQTAKVLENMPRREGVKDMSAQKQVRDL